MFRLMGGVVGNVQQSDDTVAQDRGQSSNNQVAKSDGGAGAWNYSVTFSYQWHRAVHHRCPATDLEPADPYRGMYLFCHILYALQ